ncbi:MAG TPA: PEPxxWA-CTERM sorting domain-containing protein [Sphingomonas sp.]|nr:PEPxxWA-CTERM sorting domain-containing protein [Sphingomonas sp.]
MKRYAFAASLVIAALGTGTAQAATTVTVVSGTRGVVVASNGPVAQTFVANDSLLTNFGFQFSSSLASVTTGSVTFSLLAGVATSGTAIATQTVTLAGLANRSGAFYDVFTGSAALVAGQTYTALLTNASANLSLLFGPNSSGSIDAYVPGVLIKNNALDQACTSNSYCDANFRFTTTAAAAVPEAGTWALMLLGFGMVGAAMRYRRRTTLVRFA